ncbi:MAG: hypothetical protein LBR24_04360 [Methanobrevibacter sp.]|jgi:hypothetical protein|nr:hypothetical protein [Methanobrevibacter sp.]
MTYERLKASERNRIIHDFLNKKPDPNFDVYDNGNGKYTIKRKTPIKKETPVKPVVEEENNIIIEENPPDEPKQDEKADEDEQYNPFTDNNMYLPQYKLSKMQMFSQMQMLMNQMFIENFKALRIQQKKTEKKRKLVGQKAKKIHDILVQVANQDDEPEPQPEPQPQRINNNIFPQKSSHEDEPLNTAFPNLNENNNTVNTEEVPPGPPYNRFNSRRNNLKDLMPF